MIRDVVLLMNARVAMSAGRALAGVIVPIYLAQIGYSALLLGVLFSTIGIVSAVLSASIGLVSDRLGRKPFIVAVPLLSTAAAIVFAFSQNTGMIFVFAALGTFGRGAGAGGGTVGPYQPVEQALVVDVTPSERRNSVFGRLAFSSALGALVGGLLARIPDVAERAGLEGTDAFMPAFLMIGLLSLTAALLAVPVRNPPTTRSSTGFAISLPKQSWPFLLKLWTTNSINGVAIGFVGPFLTYWFFRRYGAGPGTIGLLYAMVNAVSMASNLSAATIATRFGLVRTVVAGRAVQASLLAAMALAPWFWLAGAIYLIRMLGQRIAMPLRQSYVLAMVPAEERGAVAGLANVPAQATSSASPSLAGYLFGVAPLYVPFVIGALFQGIQTVLFWVFFRHMPPPEERGEGPHIVEVPESSVTESKPVARE